MITIPVFVDGEETEGGLCKVTVGEGRAGCTKMFPAQVCCGTGVSLGWGWGGSSEVSVDPNDHGANQTVLLRVGKVKEFFWEKDTK